MMRTQIALLSLLTATLMLLNGCGLKGDLYMETEQPPAPVEQSSPPTDNDVTPQP